MTVSVDMGTDTSGEAEGAKLAWRPQTMVLSLIHI